MTKHTIMSQNEVISRNQASGTIDRSEHTVAINIDIAAPSISRCVTRFTDIVGAYKHNSRIILL